MPVRHRALDPLSLPLGSSLELAEPFCEGLQFSVMGRDVYCYEDESGEYFEFVDYRIEAACADPENPYHYQGKVQLTLRALPAGEQQEVLLFWGEDDRTLGDLWLAKVKRPSFVHSFADGERSYVALPECGSILAAWVWCQPDNAEVQVHYRVYQTPAEAEGTGEPYALYLLIEQVQSGCDRGRVFVRRGYDMLPENILR